MFNSIDLKECNFAFKSNYKRKKVVIFLFMDRRTFPYLKAKNNSNKEKTVRAYI